MKAAILKAIGSPLAIEDVAAPQIGSGEVLIDVVASRVLPYAAEIFNGVRKYLISLPMIPGAGAIGRVRAIGPDATRLQVGDWVMCDPTVRSRDDAQAPDILLQGLTAGNEGALKLHQYFHDGSFAEQVRVPTENAIRICAGDAMDTTSAKRWCALSILMVPYGGLLAARVQAGETVLISGATGNFGSAAVAVALAMGAARVIAPGRNAAALEDLSKRFGKRVFTVQLTGNDREDQQRLRRAADGNIDCVFDILPPSAGPAPVRTAALTVRPNGRVVLMGGVGTQGEADLALPYAWMMRNNISLIGQWMFAREAFPRMIAMARAGLVDLDQFAITAFPLENANDAVAHAAQHGGPFQMTLITP